MTDVLVVGAGLAGLTAANYIAQRGLRVKLLYTGFGSTALSSGRFCIIDRTKPTRLSLREKYEKLPSEHPYKILSENSYEKFITLVREAKDEFDRMASNLYTGKPESSKPVLYQTGVVMETTFIMDTMEPSLLDGEFDKVTLVGLEGLYESDPHTIEIILKNNLSKLDLGDLEVESVILPRREFTNKNGSIFDSATIDEDKLTRNLVKIHEEKGGRILIPPILRYPKIREIKEDTDGEVGEFPAEPKFAVGLRVINQMISEAWMRGVEIVHVEGLEIKNVNERPLAIYRTKTSSERIDPEKIVLATGDLIGGGIRAIKKEGELIYIDTAMNRVIDKKNANHKDHYFSKKTSQLLNPGYKINPKSQPINERGEPISENIYVAGSIIGNNSLEGEGTGLGLPLISALVASKSILDEW